MKWNKIDPGVLFLLLLVAIILLFVVDVAGLPIQSTTTSIVRFYYKKPHTDYYFQPNGKTVIVIPDSHPGEWRAVVTINGFEIILDDSLNYHVNPNSLKIGNHLDVSFYIDNIKYQDFITKINVESDD